MSDYCDIHYASHDGLLLYARDYACQSDTPRGTVLCMHGLTRNSGDFHGLAQHLAEHYRVISVDQRGRGLSDYDSEPANYNPQTYVQDMFTLLEVLSLEKVILVGTSMGGLMAFMMATLKPESVEAMVINDIGPEVDPAGLERIKGYVGKSKPVTTWEDAVAQCREINALAFPDFTDDQWQEFTHVIYRNVDGKPLLAYDPAIAQPIEVADESAVPPDLWPVFSAIAATPMLVIRGESSDILAPECVAEMKRRKADLQFTEVPNRGHAPTLDEAEARQAIDQFLHSH